MAYKSKYFQRKSTQQKQYKSKYLQKKAQNLDIAPVRTTVNSTTTTTKDEDERKWFQKGAFEDGYQFGDVMRTILAPDKESARLVESGEYRDANLLDITWNSLKRGFYNSRYGEESFAAMNGEENEKQKYEDILAGEEYKFVPSNILEKGVSGAFELLGQQGRQFTHPRTVAMASTAAGSAFVAGQLGPQVALPEEVVSVPVAFGAGLAAGSVATNLEIEAGFAYNEMIDAGISEETAKKIAWGVGGINAGLELLQVDELLDAYKATKAAGTTKTFTKKILNELKDRGIDVAKETAQEVAQEGVTIAGTQAASKIDKGEWAYSADEVTHRLLDTAESSALSFGMMNVPAAARNVYFANADPKNAQTLTEYEQKVVDHEFEKRIADQELTEREKNEVRNKVIQDMVNGYITTDTIEEVLGGETYKAHTDTIAREKAMQEEYDTLYQMKSGDKSDAQIDRQAELKKQLDEIKQNFNRNQLGDEVMSLVKGSRLAESYNERSRRGQAFQVDVSKYDAKMRPTIQKAIDSGILNNTNRTHEFVDMIAKITADKGIPFDFTNNEKLKNSRFSIDGKTVNGYVTKDGVTLNIDSAKSLNSVVGHEITHVLEGTEMYTALQSVVAEYAKTKGEYQSRYDALTKLYEGIDGADVDAELTADLVGDYLFSDTDFVKHLSVTNRNVFQKIFDEIKYLAKVATAGSKEAQELEKVKKLFEQAYRESGKAQTETKTKYSLTDRTTPTYKELTSKDPIRIVDVKSGIETGSYADMRDAAKKTAIDEGWFDKPHYNADTDSLIFLTDESFSHAYSNLSADFGEDTIRCMAHIPEIIQNAVLVHVEDPKNPNKQETKVYTFFGAIDGVGGVEPVKLIVKEYDFKSENAVKKNIRKYFEENGIMEQYDTLYDAKALEVIGIEGVKKEPDASGKVNEQGSQAQATSDSTISVADLLNLVKGDAEKYLPKKQFSLSDSDGKQLSEGQQDDIAPVMSLSDVGETPDNHGLAPLNKFRHRNDVYGEDIRLETAENSAPVQEATVAEKTTVAEDLFPDDLAPVTKPAKVPEAYEAPTYDAQPRKGVAEGQQSMFEEPATEDAAEEARKQTRKQLHQSIVDGVRAVFKSSGLDFDSVLKKAKNLSTFATVDNTPQRVMEKALGYKEGQILSDLTVNKVAQNETESIKWLNSFTDRKNGLLRRISDQYHIKPGSKESAAAQMYAEGFYVAENKDIIAYGDAELAKDFPDPRVQKNIKGLARDPRIREIYDETLDMINASRTRNAYPEIQKLDNYFLHFRAMDDTFSKLGLPFNPNDIRAKDLPTDLNGVTADLKPGQPYFASAMHRTGKRTSFDLLGGLERYLTSAKNQIYHIDDIQTLRALRNYIADTYGQANGLEGLDALSEEEAQDRIERVYNSHLSTFAKFLNEEANILAGKTALIDRGFEGLFGRRGMTFLDTLNKQVGSNMVGYNISSSLTNFLPVAQTFAKTNKFDFVKAFAQTVGNKIGSVFGRTDSFTENSPVIIRRKGADRFYRTPWQKLGDPGYALMGAVDDISTELIARTKFNELTRKGMDAQKAHYETDKWVSRLMGDRSLGQMPQIYNSKMLGLVTKFQLEVRNQLDSQFYDTIQETKVSAEHIENGLARNAKIAAKVTSTFVQLAVVQHLFGRAFESVAGYNPAFDIISVLMTAFGYDDEEDSEDAALDNVEQAFLELLEDLPYTSTFTGGRIPISSALPIEELVKGVDEWGNEKSRWETLGEIAPYYVLPGGYGQIKKTVQGLDMFSKDHPISGSYTGKGDLRFPVEDTPANRVQAAIFGQWASENARDYFDNNRAPLKEKQIQEFMDVDIPIRDYWEYREGLSGLSKLEEKADYIAGLDLPIDKKNLLINNLADREEDIDLTGYEDFSGFEEFDFAVNNPEQYEIAQKVGGYEAYMKYQEGMKGMKLAEKADYVTGLDLTTEQKNALINGETDRKEPIDLTGYENYSSLEELDFATKYPENYAVAKAVGGYEAYKGYSDELNDIKSDKDANGKTINGSRKEKVMNYINSLDADYHTKIILWKSEYPSDDTYNYEIIDYLNGRDDISFDEMVAILRKLGFDVTDNGDISW